MGLRWTILDLGKHYLPTNHLFTEVVHFVREQINKDMFQGTPKCSCVGN